jgi:hypothetical protein
VFFTVKACGVQFNNVPEKYAASITRGYATEMCIVKTTHTWTKIYIPNKTDTKSESQNNEILYSTLK